MSQDIMEVIARLRWHVAKIQPPHEWTCKERDGAVEDWLALFEAIQRDGVFERWKGRKKRYLYLGDGWKYFAMTTNPYYSRIINRQRVAEDVDRLRQEGQTVRDIHGQPVQQPGDEPSRG